MIELEKFSILLIKLLRQLRQLKAKIKQLFWSFIIAYKICEHEGSRRVKSPM